MITSSLSEKYRENFKWRGFREKMRQSALVTGLGENSYKQYNFILKSSPRHYLFLLLLDYNRFGVKVCLASWRSVSRSKLLMSRVAHTSSKIARTSEVKTSLLLQCNLTSREGLIISWRSILSCSAYGAHRDMVVLCSLTLPYIIIDPLLSLQPLLNTLSI